MGFECLLPPVTMFGSSRIAHDSPAAPDAAPPW